MGIIYHSGREFRPTLHLRSKKALKPRPLDPYVDAAFSRLGRAGKGIRSLAYRMVGKKERPSRRAMDALHEKFRKDSRLSADP